MPIDYKHRSIWRRRPLSVACVVVALVAAAATAICQNPAVFGLHEFALIVIGAAIGALVTLEVRR